MSLSASTGSFGGSDDAGDSRCRCPRGAKRLVIDSLVGFEMALAPGFRDDFRESLYRMIVALTGGRGDHSDHG